MHEYYCIGFKSLLDYKNLFSPDDHEQNDNTKKNSITKKMKKYTALFLVSIENLKNLEYHTSQKKYQFFLIFAVHVKVNNNTKKKENQFRY